MHILPGSTTTRKPPSAIPPTITLTILKACIIQKMIENQFSKRKNVGTFSIRNGHFGFIESHKIMPIVCLLYKVMLYGIFIVHMIWSPHGPNSKNVPIRYSPYKHFVHLQFTSFISFRRSLISYTLLYFLF